MIYHIYRLGVLNVFISKLKFVFLPPSPSLKLKSGQQIPSPSELMGKILIKNKKGSQEKPSQTKKTAASTEQNAAAAAAANPQDGANPSANTQDSPGWVSSA